MKKFTRILSLALMMAVVLSMSIMSFTVSAEEAAAPGATYVFDNNVAAGEYVKGPFSLRVGNHPVENTVPEAGQTTFAAPTSDGYLLNILSGASIVFTAPVDGTYSFTFAFEKLAYTTGEHSSYVQFFLRAGSDNSLPKAGTAGEMTTSGAKVEIDRSGWELKAGDMIVMSVGYNKSEADNNAVAFKDFTVKLNGGAPAGGNEGGNEGGNQGGNEGGNQGGNNPETADNTVSLVVAMVALTGAGIAIGTKKRRNQR